MKRVLRPNATGKLQMKGRSKIIAGKLSKTIKMRFGLFCLTITKSCNSPKNTGIMKYAAPLRYTATSVQITSHKASGAINMEALCERLRNQW